MKQYCRYCTQCISEIGDGYEWVYCEKKNEFHSVKYAESPNNCKEFDFVNIDAFGINDNGYRPRKKKMKDCEGQLSLDFSKTDGSENTGNA